MGRRTPGSAPALNVLATPLQWLRGGALRRAVLLSLMLQPLAAQASAPAALTIDGRLDEPQWSQAAQCGPWLRTQPLTRDEARYGNELRILSTPQGLAAAFIIDQPPAERRMKPRTPRDSEQLIGDSVGLVVDFDATGQLGYEFSVGLGGGVRDGMVTNQNSFDRDWDGAWQHAVRETEDQWFVEILIPWSSVNMRAASGSDRTIAVYGTRYLYERAERYACPGLSSESAIFLSDLQRLTIPQHDFRPTLDVVPYASAIADLLDDEGRYKVGGDISWRPLPNLWVGATLNPDFGQVESDELVVNFTAIETAYTDKRPFFSENQGIFNLRTPANGQLIYTRRVGAATDDGLAGSADIDAAVKLTGTARSLTYGAFVAQEDDYRSDVGRLFAATRLALPLERSRLGYLGSWVDRPFLDRSALVNSVDYEYSPSESWRLSGQLTRSDITQGVGDQRSRTHGYQGWLQADFNVDAPLSHTLKLLQIDDTFDINDLGYMERNSLRQLELDSIRRVGGSGVLNGQTQRFWAWYRENDAGERLPSRILYSHELHFANTWRAYMDVRYITSGVDDRLSRGNGPVEIEGRSALYLDATTPRLGNWQFTFGGYLYQQGVADHSGWLQFLAAWYPTETLTLRLDVLPQYSADWLIWQQDNQFGSFRSRRLDYDFRLDWIPAPRHELRVKLQWIGVDASVRQAYRTDPAGRLRAVDEPLAPFTINNLGLQVRYRYEIGPMSEVFLVYARGGYQMLDDHRRDVPGLLSDMVDVRDADQFMIKVRYRL